jgi:hypothetical protein
MVRRSEIGREELFRFLTLTPADRLGLAVAVCTLPWLGFVPDEVSSGRCPVPALGFVLSPNGATGVPSETGGPR